MALRRILRSQRGAVSWTVVAVISIVVIILGLAVAQLGDAETLQSVVHRSKNDVYFVADSGRRISEQCFQRFMLGSVKQNIKNVTDAFFQDVVASGDPVLLLERCTLIPRIEPGHARYRVNLNGGTDTANLVLAPKTTPDIPIWNEVNPGDNQRTFDTVIDVETGDVPVETEYYWAFPLRFRIAVKAKAPTMKGRSAIESMVGRGIVTLYVNRRSFANYVEYTCNYDGLHGEQSMTGRDAFYGPVHTGGKFRFMDSPGTYFQNEVTTKSLSALFFDTSDGTFKDLTAQYLVSGNKKSYETKPQFNPGLFFKVSPTDPPTSYNYFRVVTLGSYINIPVDTSSAANNIYTAADETPTVMAMRTGGVLVVGDCDILLQDVGGNQLYTFTHYDAAGAVLGTSTVTLDYTNNQTIIQRRGQAAPKTFAGVLDADKNVAGPQGAIYVRGKIKSIRGSLASNTQVTIEAIGPLNEEYGPVGKPGITITGDLTYTSPPVNRAATAPSILGLVSETGDVVLNYPVAPTDITIHAHIMVLAGEFWCAHSDGPMKGSINLFGSVSSVRAGRMGTRTTGYAKKYTLDTRATFSPPPFYPSQSKYGVIFEKPETGKSTWRVVWANESLE